MPSSAQHHLSMALPVGAMGGKQERSRTTIFSDCSSMSDTYTINGKGAPQRIPADYVQVMEQVEQHGWDKMMWSRGYTLLHWASKNNMPELCTQFMWQGADPYHCDNTN